MITSNPFEGERRAGTVGFPLPDIKVRIMKDGQEAEVQKGEVGMIEVNGPNVFKGYWKMPEKTAEELRDNGFLITGDLGYIDEDNYLHIVGRKKDLIISGGYNIYPKEVELVLDDLPGVLESAVIGVPHPDFGEAVIAVLVASPNSNIDISNVHAKLELNLAKYKQPKKLFLIKSLPRNTMGKVQKNLLRDTHKNLFMTV
jgi:malonyl-CoA/methylmalonyl-CoA synthetase